jgi:hypothetical protein
MASLTFLSLLKMNLLPQIFIWGLIALMGPITRATLMHAVNLINKDAEFDWRCGVGARAAAAAGISPHLGASLCCLFDLFLATADGRGRMAATPNANETTTRPGLF